MRVSFKEDRNKYGGSFNKKLRPVLVKDEIRKGEVTF